MTACAPRHARGRATGIAPERLPAMPRGITPAPPVLDEWSGLVLRTYFDPSLILGEPAVEFVALGTPAPQGSKRHVGGGRLIESSAKVRPWRQDVRAAAEDAVAPLRPEWRPLDGPLAVRMVFTLRKPASAPKRTRTYPNRTPDLSKLVRSTEDALTSVVWVDDARVVEYVRLAKVYPGEDAEALDSPGVRIAVYRVGG